MVKIKLQFIKNSFTFIIILVSAQLLTLDISLPVSASENANAGLGILSNSPASITKNPAYNNNGYEISASYLFNLPDLPYYNAFLGKTINNLYLGLGNSFLAHPLYKESDSYLTINYGYKNFTAGVSVRNLYYKIDAFNNESFFTADLGFCYNHENYKTAFSLKNISAQDKISHPNIYIWESRINLTKQSIIALGLEKEIDYDFIFRFGSNYHFHEMFALAAGYQYKPARLSCGFSVNWSEINLSYSVRTHQYLNLTHFISLGYGFKN